MADNTEIEKFDPAKLMDGVRDRIKATFVGMIPDQIWDKMVEREIYIFTTGQIIPHHECDYKTQDENGNYVYKDWEERKPYSQQEIMDNYGRSTGKMDISPLQQMIREELHARFRKNLKAMIEGPDFQAIWDEHGVPRAGKAIEDIVVKNVDSLFVSFLKDLIQQGFDRVRYNMQ